MRGFYYWRLTERRPALNCVRKLSRSLGGRQVGVRQVDEYIRLVTFMHYDLD